MAIDMQEVIARKAATSAPGLNIRIGINTGPVVAGVIGRNKFIYDLWGDAVNIASRMESHGEPGAIQVSESTAALLEGQFELEARGVIEIKGKGKMNTVAGAIPRVWWASVSMRSVVSQFTQASVIETP